MGFFNDLSGSMLSTAKKTAAESGVDVVTLANTEQGGVDVQKRDLGNGVNAYLDENGQISSFSRVDPARPGMIQLYGPNGESRGEQKITSTTQDLIKNLGPIALAAGGSYLAQGLLGPAASTAGLDTLAAADMAGGLLPEFGTNALYDSFMTSAMTPEALASLAATAAAAPEVIGSGNLLTNAAAGIPPVVTPPVVVPPGGTPPVVPPVVTPPVVTPPVVPPVVPSRKSVKKVNPIA
jgi:hypothetical protein